MSQAALTSSGKRTKRTYQDMGGLRPVVSARSGDLRRTLLGGFVLGLRDSNLGFVSDFVLRISCFRDARTVPSSPAA
jgi:hypothetical protein